MERYSKYNIFMYQPIWIMGAWGEGGEEGGLLMFNESKRSDYLAKAILKLEMNLIFNFGQVTQHMHKLSCLVLFPIRQCPLLVIVVRKKAGINLPLYLDWRLWLKAKSISLSKSLKAFCSKYSCFQPPNISDLHLWANTNSTRSFNLGWASCTSIWPSPNTQSKVWWGYPTSHEVQADWTQPIFLKGNQFFGISRNNLPKTNCKAHLSIGTLSKFLKLETREVVCWDPKKRRRQVKTSLILKHPWSHPHISALSISTRRTKLHILDNEALMPSCLSCEKGNIILA